MQNLLEVIIYDAIRLSPKLKEDVVHQNVMLCLTMKKALGVFFKKKNKKTLCLISWFPRGAWVCLQYVIVVFHD